MGGHGNVLTSADQAGGSGAWTLTPVAAHGSLSSVSCPTVSLCVAIGSAGIAVSTDPAGGPARWSLTPGGTAAALSCPTTQLCVAVDFAGDLITSTDPAGGAGAWTTTSLEHGTCYRGACSAGTFTGLSCPSESLCVAVAATIDERLELGNPPPELSGRKIESSTPARGARSCVGRR